MWQWPGPGDDEAPGPGRLPTLAGLMTALMGSGRAAEVGSAMAVLGELRPPGPHAYLHLLGVDPGCRGEGLGGRLLDEGVAAARAVGLTACLDTMNPANVPFYEAHGLSVRHEFALLGGPTVYSMAI
jgi:GNAT superfamily N-acetyltransferase